MDHIVALCAQCALIPHSASPGYPPPPWAAPLPTGCWVHFQHSLSTSSQWQWICLFVLFLFLCLFPFAQVRLLLCSLCFLHQYPVSCVLFALCSGLPLISSAVFLCACSYPRCLLSGVVLASALGLFWVLSGLPRSHAGAVAVNSPQGGNFRWIEGSCGSRAN